MANYLSLYARMKSIGNGYWKPIMREVPRSYLGSSRKYCYNLAISVMSFGMKICGMPHI